MGLEVIPQDIRERYHIEERRHASAILASDFKAELQDVLDCLRQFMLLRSEIIVGGGGKSKIASRFDDFLLNRGWREKTTRIGKTVDGKSTDLETHKVDFCKGRIAIEVEWNNKDPFFSRDLGTFRLLHEQDIISVGVFITRMDELQRIFDSLGRDIGAKYGPSTTHLGKLLPRIAAGEGGACPLLLIGISPKCYVNDVQ
jgi:hypothetical protein